MGWSHTRVWQLRTGRVSQVRKSLLISKRSQPHTGVPSLDHKWWEEESSQHLLVKVSEDIIQMRWGCWKLRRQPKRPEHKLTNTLSSSKGTPVWKAAGTYGEEMNCLTSGWGLEEQLSPGLKCSKRCYSFVEPSPYPACRCRWMPNLSLH